MAFFVFKWIYQNVYIPVSAAFRLVTLGTYLSIRVMPKQFWNSFPGVWGKSLSFQGELDFAQPTLIQSQIL